MYTVAEVDNRELWDTLAGTVLLQSWNWGEFQQKIGHKVWRLGVFDRGVFIGGASVILVQSRLRSHLYMSNGPFIIDKRPDLTIPAILDLLLPVVKQLVTPQLAAHFIRIDPLIESSEPAHEELLLAGFKKAPTHVQPERTILIDLTKSSEEILLGMSPSQRNGVKRGIKDGVTVRYSTTREDFELFWSLYQNTVSMKHFVTYSKNYYWTQFQTLAENGNYEVCIASVNGHPQTVSLVGYDTETAYYLHTGRAYSHDPLTKHASKVQVWDLLQHAKQRGMKSFNLFGISKKDNDFADPWAGLTEFKKGFGGTAVSYVGAYDYPLSLWYWFIWILERTRKLWGYPYFLAKKFLKL